MSYFLQACVRGDLHALRHLLANPDVNINIVCPRTGDTALHLAARAGNQRIVEALLAVSINVSVQNHEGMQAVHCAMVAHHKKIAIMIAMHGVREGREVLEAALETKLPYQHVMKWQQFHLVTHLLNLGIACDDPDKVGATPLMRAVSAQQIGLVQTMLMRLTPAQINVASCDGRTALHLACLIPNQDAASPIVQALLDKGARKDLADVYQSVPFDLLFDTSGPVARLLQGKKLLAVTGNGRRPKTQAELLNAFSQGQFRQQKLQQSADSMEHRRAQLQAFACIRRP